MMICRSAPLAWLLAASLAAPSHGQKPVPARGQAPAPGPGPTHIFTPAEETAALPPAPPLDLSLRVNVDGMVVPKAKIKSYDKVAEFMTKARIGVPDDRVAYFNSISVPIAEPFTGWVGYITKITPTADGFVVDVRVRVGRGGVIDTAHIIERYAVVNGQVSYVSSFVPPNQNRMFMHQ